VNVVEKTIVKIVATLLCITYVMREEIVLKKK